MRALSLATIFAALSGFVVIYLASWTLDNQGYAEFQAYWGLFFACTGFLDGLMQETTRAVSAAKETGRRGNANPWRLGIILGFSALLIVAASGFWWMPMLVTGSTGSATTLIAIGLLFYTFQAVLSGILSGLGLWTRYAWLVALDSGVRLVLALGAWLLGWNLLSFLLITVIGAASWLVILASSAEARQAIRTGVDVDRASLARRVGSAMLATGASAVLITGFPVLVQATSEPDAGTMVTVAGIINAVTLTRAPILVPLQRFQSALIVRFVSNRGNLYSALLTPVAVVLGIGVLGGGLAWLIGPWILDTFFKPELGVPGPILGALTFASACTGTLMITGSATLALEQHRAYVTGWIAATAIALVVLMLPLALETAVCAALLIGPLIGILVHLVAVRSGAATPTNPVSTADHTGDPADSGATGGQPGLD
ncbi:lipopolysaccharide biosynthesis protein [Corynebacterium sp. A21]|uniref:lipopolysaccharide biosynthesis protein n=1 Tax=Corynebacterium sp. A21 TaxID=3457318 RepID=UPI003FD3F358